MNRSILTIKSTCFCWTDQPDGYSYGTQSGTPTSYTQFVPSLISAFNLTPPAQGETGTAASGVNAFGTWEIGATGDESKGDANKVFVTIILFDKNYNFLDAAYSASSGTGALISKSYTAKQPGYAYLYISNEQPFQMDVYFDDVQMSLTPGAVVQMEDYYPFGLAFNSYSRENAVPQKFLYDGKELQTDLGLNWEDYGKRMYMPELGRWGATDSKAEGSRNLSPYRYGFNNPIRFLDRDGQYEIDGHFWTVFLMSTLMGSDQALNIAQWTESPDHIVSAAGDPIEATMTWINPLKQGPLHALTGGRSSAERDISDLSIDASDNTKELGEALHRLGDSFAHSKVSDRTQMYLPPFGHAASSIFSTDPDKIANRPWLYIEYVERLANSLGKRLSFSGSIDLFPFLYIAESGANTEENSAVLEAETRIRQGVKSFNVAGDQVNAIKRYVSISNNHYGRNKKVNSWSGWVDVYRRDSNDKWHRTSEYRSFATISDE